MKHNHPILGKLYLFKLGEIAEVFITPAEIATHSAYKGMIIGYVFKREKSPEELYANGCKSDLLIPPVLLYPQCFRDGTFKYVENTQSIRIPFYKPHVFYNEAMRKFRDLQGNTLLGPGECTSIEEIHSVITFCQVISQALRFNIDCSALIPVMNPAEKSKLTQLPKADYNNRRPLAIEVAIPPETDPTKDAILELGDIEDALDAQLKKAQAGAVMGNAADEVGDIIELRIKTSRYPQALPAIRAAMESVGIKRYELLYYK